MKLNETNNFRNRGVLRVWIPYRNKLHEAGNSGAKYEKDHTGGN